MAGAGPTSRAPRSAASMRRRASFSLKSPVDALLGLFAMSDKRPPFQSVLEEHPEHVKAIGMLQIEATNLEHALGTFLAAFLDLREDIGQIIYLTPKTTLGRLEIIENLIGHCLVEKSEGHKQLSSITARSRKIFGKRHTLIHGTWGITDGKISMISGPPTDSANPVPWTKDQINEIVQDIRKLVTDMQGVIVHLRSHHHEERQKGNPSPISQSRGQTG